MTVIQSVMQTMSGAIKPWKLTISVDAFCGLVSNQFPIVIYVISMERKITACSTNKSCYFSKFAKQSAS